MYKDKTKQREANRQASQRKRDKAKGMTQAGMTPVPTDLEQCRYCGKPLPALAKPRRYPGACYPCAIKRPARPSIEALGDTVYAGAELPEK